MFWYSLFIKLLLHVVNWKQQKDKFWTSTLSIDTKAIKPTIASFQYADLNLMMMVMMMMMNKS